MGGRRLRSGDTQADSGQEKAHSEWLCRARPTQPPLLPSVRPRKTVFHCSTASTRGSARCPSSRRSEATGTTCTKTCQSHETKPSSRAVTWSELRVRDQQIVCEEFCL